MGHVLWLLLGIFLLVNGLVGLQKADVRLMYAAYVAIGLCIFVFWA